MKDHVEVKYKGQPVDNDETGRLAAVKVHRQVFRAPRNSRGDVQWSKGKHTHEAELVVPVMEIGALVAELISWLDYYASGQSDIDKE